MKHAKPAIWRTWARRLAPKDESKDPLFAAEMSRLAVLGLRVIGAICIGAIVLWLIVAILLYRDLSFVIGYAPLFFVILALVALFISSHRVLRRHARWIALVLIYIIVMIDIFGSYSVDVTPGERQGLISAAIALALLIGIAALPVKPLQMLLLGSMFILTYVTVTTTFEWAQTEHGVASFSLVYIIMAVFVCTGLTAVVYHQRLSTFQARRAAEDAFEQLRDTQAQLMVSENAASQGRFAAALSHDLNNPLGALSSSLDTIVRVHDRERNHPDQKERMEAVFDNAAKSGREAAGRLGEIIERMKRVSNLDRADQQLVDLNELWRDTVAFLGEDIEHKMELVMDLSPLPRIQCQPQQLSAVFSRLLWKAVDSTDGKSKVYVKSRLRDGKIVIEVQCPGKDIAPGRPNELFDPSFYTEGKRVKTDWDLLIARNIIVQHGGHIEFDSKEGHGTTIRIIFTSTVGSD